MLKCVLFGGGHSFPFFLISLLKLFNCRKQKYFFWVPSCWSGVFNRFNTMLCQEILYFNAFYRVLLTFYIFAIKYLNSTAFKKLSSFYSECRLLLLVSSVDLCTFWVLWDVIKARYILPRAIFKVLFAWFCLIYLFCSFFLFWVLN